MRNFMEHETCTPALSLRSIHRATVFTENGLPYVLPSVLCGVDKNFDLSKVILLYKVIYTNVV